MTVETTDSIVEYTGNGVTTAFPVPFEFPANEDLVVTQVYNDVSTVLVLGTDYLVVGAGAQAGGAVITTVAPPIGAVINISRELEALQKTDLRNQGRYFAETHESVFDYLTMLIQQGFSGLSRALRRPSEKTTSTRKDGGLPMLQILPRTKMQQISNGQSSMWEVS